MRDPLGSIHVENGVVIRRLKKALESSAFLKQSNSQELVENNQLVSFQFQTDVLITSPLLPFVSYPHEWCDAQFYDAADLTLSISEDCEKTDWELKDASAWNIIFDGTHPIFCDHLSFQPIERKNWWAFAQYIRHFVLPLCISKHAGIHAYETFKSNRDGLQTLQAKNILGLRRFFTRYWPLLIDIKAATTKLQEKEIQGPHRHKNLFSMTRFYLKGLQPKVKKSVWSDYVDERNHYTHHAQLIKKEKIGEWLKQTQPQWVADFGCNTGEFSRLACEHDAKVIALDFDHESIQQLYLTEKENHHIHPVVADLDDIFSGRGWAGTEFKGLVERISHVNEMAFMLALIHHIAISNSIPYTKIAEFARSVTKKWLIVELLGEEDPLVNHLCKQRDRSPQDFTLDQQIRAFDEFFTTLEIHDIEGTHRQLRLLAVRDET